MHIIQRKSHHFLNGGMFQVFGARALVITTTAISCEHKLSTPALKHSHLLSLRCPTWLCPASVQPCPFAQYPSSPCPCDPSGCPRLPAAAGRSSMVVHVSTGHRSTLWTPHMGLKVSRNPKQVCKRKRASLVMLADNSARTCALRIEAACKGAFWLADSKLLYCICVRPEAGIGSGLNQPKRSRRHEQMSRPAYTIKCCCAE